MITIYTYNVSHYTGEVYEKYNNEFLSTQGDRKVVRGTQCPERCKGQHASRVGIHLDGLFEKVNGIGMNCEVVLNLLEGGKNNGLQSIEDTEKNGSDCPQTH